VTCVFTTDNYVSKVYIDGEDKTSSVQGDLNSWPTKKHMTFKSNARKLAFQVNDAERGCRNGGFAISCTSKATNWVMSSNSKKGWKVFSEKASGSKNSLKATQYPPAVGDTKWYDLGYPEGDRFKEPRFGETTYADRVVKTDGKNTQDFCGGDSDKTRNHWFFIYNAEPPPDAAFPITDELVLDLRSGVGVSETKWENQVKCLNYCFDAVVPNSVKYDKKEKAWFFPGKGQVISVPLPTNNRKMDKVTYAGWVKPLDYLGTLGWVLTQYPDYGWSRSITMSDGRIGGFGLTPGAYNSGFGNMPLGKWSHVVGIWRGRGKCSMYLNNKKYEKEGCGNGEGTRSDEKFVIGGRGPNDSTHNAKVFISDVQVFRKALTDDEVKTLYNDGKRPTGQVVVSTAFCGAGGVFVRQTGGGSCVPASCGVPPQRPLTVAFSSSDIKFGETFTYQCATGYAVDNAAGVRTYDVKCGKDQKITGFKDCKPICCGGVHNPCYGPGGERKVTCPAGHTTTGKPGGATFFKVQCKVKQNGATSIVGAGNCQEVKFSVGGHVYNAANPSEAATAMKVEFRKMDHDGKGKWKLGEAGQSCEQTCTKASLMCYETSQVSHNSEVDTPERLKLKLKGLGKTCGKYAKTGPRRQPFSPGIKKGECIVSAVGRLYNTFDCKNKETDVERLCYCQHKLPADAVVATTDGSGNYAVSLAKAHYHAKVFCKSSCPAGFSTDAFNIRVDKAMSPSMGTGGGPTDFALYKPLKDNDMRITLTWGKTPKDLDAILVYGDEVNCNMQTGDCTGTCVTSVDSRDVCKSIKNPVRATLILDATEGWGPEAMLVSNVDKCIPGPNTNCAAVFLVKNDKAALNYVAADEHTTSYKNPQAAVYKGTGYTTDGKFDFPAAGDGKEQFPMFTINTATGELHEGFYDPMSQCEVNDWFVWVYPTNTLSGKPKFSVCAHSWKDSKVKDLFKDNKVYGVRYITKALFFQRKYKFKVKAANFNLEVDNSPLLSGNSQSSWKTSGEITLTEGQHFIDLKMTGVSKRPEIMWVDETGNEHIRGLDNTFPIPDMIVDMRGDEGFLAGSKKQLNRISSGPDADVGDGVTYDASEKAWSFPGKGQVMTIPIATSPTKMTAVTYSAWVKPLNYLGTLGWVMSQYPDYGWSRALTMSDGRLGGTGVTPGGYNSGIGNMPLNKWSHVVGIWHSNGGTCTVFGNMKKYSRTCSNGQGGSTEKLILGGRGPNDGTHNARWLMSDVAVYSRALTDNEVEMLYNGGTRPSLVGGLTTTTTTQAADAPLVPGGLILDFRGNDGIGTDYWKNQINGGPSASFPTTVKYDSAEKAWSFPGKAAVMQVPLATNPSKMTAVSYSAWVKPLDYLGTLGWVLTQYPDYGWSRSVTISDGRLGGTGVTPGGYNSGLGNLPLNKWSHLVGVWTKRGGTCYIYANKQKYSRSCSSGQGSNGNEKFIIGGRGPNDGGHNPKVLMTDVAVWNRALTEAEVVTLYNGGMRPSQETCQAKTVNSKDDKKYYLAASNLGGDSWSFEVEVKAKNDARIFLGDPNSDNGYEIALGMTAAGRRRYSRIASKKLGSSINGGDKGGNAVSDSKFVKFVVSRDGKKLTVMREGSVFMTYNDMTKDVFQYFFSTGWGSTGKWKFSVCKASAAANAHTAPWKLVKAGSWCSGSLRKDLAESGASLKQCFDLASKDAACGNQIYGNGAKCRCMLKGKECDYRTSGEGNDVWETDVPVTRGMVLDFRGTKGVSSDKWENQIPDGPDATIESGVTFNSGEKAFQFPGKAAVITVPLATNPAKMEEVSYSAWVKPQDFKGTLGWVLTQYPDYGWSRSVTISDGRLGGTGVTPGGYNSGLGNLPLNKWSHVVGTWKKNGGGCFIYLNNKKYGRSCSNGQGSATEKFIIGGRGPNDGGHNAKVMMTDVFVYNVALTSAEVTKLYNDGKVPSQQP